MNESSIKDLAFSSFKKGLTNRDGFSRAMNVLLSTTENRYIPHLVKCVKDPEQCVRDSAIFQLSHFGYSRKIFYVILEAIHNESKYEDRVEPVTFAFVLRVHGEKSFKAMMKIFNSDKSSEYSKSVAAYFLTFYLSQY